jgi:hypothetical protein
MASESSVRDISNKGYQKHIIQFRSFDNLLKPDRNEEYADIVLTNSHNRSSSFIVDLAIFRIVCSNMLVVPSQSFYSNSIIHKGFNLDKVNNAIDEVVSYMPNIQEQIETFKSINLSPIEQHSLANAASDLRFDRNLHKVDAEEFLQVHRNEDSSSDLWTVFNRVQEAMIRGGVKGVNKESGKSFTSKPIKAIDTNIKLNKELFSTVQTIAQLKEPTNYSIAV